MLKRLFILGTLCVFVGCPAVSQRRINIEQGNLNQASVINGINDISDSIEQISSKLDEYSYRLKSANDRISALEVSISELKIIVAAVQNLEEQALLKDERREEDFGNEIVSIKSDLAEISVKLMALQRALHSSFPKESLKPVKIPKNKNIP